MTRAQYRKTFLKLFEDALVEEFFSPGEPILVGAIREAAELAQEAGATEADLGEKIIAAKIRIARKKDRMRANSRRTSRRR